PLRTVNKKIIFILSPSRQRRQYFLGQIFAHRTDSEFIGIGLAKSDLTFEREKPIYENSCRAGMGLAIDEHQGAGTGADAGLLNDRIGIELRDRQSLQCGAIDAAAKETQR